jgi:(S)-2-hydroxyglutarate dehydrogenase
MASSSLPSRADVVVVGAGILGLATAAELRRREPAWTVAVVEKERAPGLHQTGRSSGVVHSGVYYAPGSLKARLCRDGRRLLFDFCDAENIPYDVCGKVIVATESRELAPLEELERRARANGVAVDRIGPERLRELEPHCSGVAALHLPETGIVEFRRVAAALGEQLERDGTPVAYDAAVTAIDERPGGLLVRTARGEVEAAYAVACAGVHADELAGTQARETRIVPFRGDYFALRAQARRLCRNLIYPVPDARFPFLGVHVNRRPDGGVWAGPNAIVALAFEGYRRRDVKLREAWRTLTYPGFVRLVGRHWRLGLQEAYRDVSRKAYAAAARRYLPELRAEDLEPAPAGIRAQALRRDGTLVDDFLFAGTARTIHVRNAPSPGATSAFAIAGHIADRALATFS